MIRPTKMTRLSLAAAALVLGLGTVKAQAVPLVVENPSFEFPDVTASGLPALPFELVPLVFPGADTGWDVAGTPIPLGEFPPGNPIIAIPIVLFPNVPVSHPDAPLARITNLDGNQAASMFVLPGTTLSQVLSDTYGVGEIITFTAGLGKSVLSPPVPGGEIVMELFYIDALIGQVAITSLPVSEADLQGTLLTDKSAFVPAVQAGDPWAGKQIGIRFVTETGQRLPGGFLNVDNVRVDSSTAAAAVPEPATVCMLAAGLSAIMIRRRRTA